MIFFQTAWELNLDFYRLGAWAPTTPMQNICQELECINYPVVGLPRFFQTKIFTKLLRPRCGKVTLICHFTSINWFNLLKNKKMSIYFRRIEHLQPLFADSYHNLLFFLLGLFLFLVVDKVLFCSILNIMHYYFMQT